MSKEYLFKRDENLSSITPVLSGKGGRDMRWDPTTKGVFLSSSMRKKGTRCPVLWS